MKNAILKVKLVVMVLGAIFVMSCSGEDGEDGAIGPAGVDGIDGQDGTDGQNGTDGEDGNANVSTFTFDISSVSGNLYDQSMPELTQLVIEEDVVLGYVKRGSDWFPLPAVGDILPFSIAVFLTPGFYALDFVDSVDGSDYTITAGSLDTLKVVIIESNNTTTSKNHHPDFTKMSYEEVMDYLGLDY